MTVKRILILANHSGGLYDFRKELMMELKKWGAVFVAVPHNDRWDELQQLVDCVTELPVDRRGMNPVHDFRLFCQYRRILKSSKPDLVITYTIKPNIYGGFAARMAGIPYAVNITGLGTAFEGSGLLRKTVTAMYRLSCKRAKTVFFENAENRQLFLDEKIAEECQACLLNGAGVNLEHYTVTDYPGGDVTRFLFIGRVMREKGVDELLAATKRLVDEGIPCTLDIVGAYEDDYEAAIQQAEAELWLRYRGYQEDVRPFIAAAHCFVLPSWHEGMANTNLECAASGRPVITTCIHGCMEAVEDGVTGFLCEKKNEDDLYRVMKRFAGLSREERRVMGLAGRKRMEAIFDKKQVVRETVARLME